MATGNLFLGTARKSVGDVTMMRRNGQQVSRVRVRKIANPRSEAQSIQRMVFASVSRFYSPLAGCLEQSWQGLSKSASYSAYLKENLKLAREQHFAAARDGGFVPMPVKVSKGTITPARIVFWDGGPGFVVVGEDPDYDTPYTIGNVSRWFKDNYGLQDGDQVTFIWSLFEVGSVGTYTVEYARMFIDPSSTDALRLGTLNINNSPGNGFGFEGPNDNLSGFCVIFSRWDGSKWLRSTQYMAVAEPFDYIGEDAQDEFLPGWMADAANAPQSDVYLNGSGTDAAVLGLKAVKLTAAGAATTDIMDVVGYGSAQFNSANAFQVRCSDGNSYFLTTINERTAAYKTMCPASGSTTINPPSAEYDFTGAVSLTLPSNVNLNGSHGAKAFNWLSEVQGDGTMALEFGYIVE